MPIASTLSVDRNGGYDGALALLSGWSGRDFGQFDPDQPLAYIETNTVRTLMHAFTKADQSRQWTLTASCRCSSRED